MKSPLSFSIIATFLLTASVALAGPHQAQTFSNAAPAHASRYAAPSATNRFNPSLSRNFSSSRWNNSRFANSSSRFGQQRSSTGRPWVSSRARALATSHNASWWHNHRHDRFVFIDTFGFDPLFFDPFYDYSYYPYYGYYPGYYPYGPGYSPGYYSGDPNYDGPDQENYPNGYSYNNNVPPRYSSDDRAYRGRSDGGVVLDVQRRLARDGYYKGTLDGVMGSRTRYAVRAYERDHRLQADGELNENFLRTLGVR